MPSEPRRGKVHRPAPDSIGERVDGVARIIRGTADDQEPFLGHLLRAALAGPGAQHSLTATRVIAVLMTALAAQGDEELVAAYLSPDLSDDATFEVRAYGRDPTVPATVVQHPGAASAMASLSSNDEDTVEVWGVAGNGLERCALSRPAGGELTFRFPDGVDLAGDPQLCADALQRWEDLWLPSNRDSLPVDTADELATARTANHDVAATLRDALADLTVRVDLAEVTDVVNAGVGGVGDEVVRRLTSSLRPASADEIALAMAPLLPTAVEVADLVTERIAQTLRDDLQRLVSGVEEQVNHVVAEAFRLAPGEVLADPDGAAEQAENKIARLVPRLGSDQEVPGVSDRRSAALRSRSRRRQRQSNGSGGGPWANGPPEG